MFDTLIVQPIFNLMMAIYSIVPFGDFGIVIIVFTIIVRFVLYPLLKRQLHQTTLMRKLQPELAKIKKNSNGNKQQEGLMMMELYKKYGVSPFRSILLVLIQLPIFFALFRVIQIFTIHPDQISKFTYDFVKNLAPVQNLIQHPDQINHHMLGFISMTDAAISKNGINFILVAVALIAGATQYFLTRQTMPQNGSNKRIRDIMSEAADGKQADSSEMNAAVMNGMSKFMPIMMTAIMLPLSGGIAFYYMISNFILYVQQKLILGRDEVELEELAEKQEVKEANNKNKKSGKRGGHSGAYASAKARERRAKEGHITRIKAKD